MSAEASAPLPGAGALGRLVSRLRAPSAPGAAAAVAAAAPLQDDTAAYLRRVDALDAQIDRQAGRLPAEATVVAHLITDLATAVLEAPTSSQDLHGRIAVEATLRDYLPTTLTSYDAALGSASASEEVAALDAQLLLQLHALRRSLAEVLVAVRDNDVRALETQTVFLRTKFSGEDL